MKGWVLCLTVLCFLPSSLAALDPDKLITQYILDTWGRDHGMPQMSARYLVQTSDGYLWIGTDDGLARFDGFRFTVFGRHNEKAFDSSSIVALCKDPEAGLWIATRAGDVIRYENNRFTDYSSRFGLTAPVQSIVTDAHGNIWIATTKEVGRIENLRFLPLKGALRRSWPLFFDRSGEMWIGSHRRKNGQNQQPAFSPDASILTIAADSSGTIWFGTEGQGLLSFRNGKVESIPEFTNKVVWAILEDRHHNLWVGTTAGLFRYRNGKTTSFNSKQGLPDDQVVSLLEDSEGNLWVGTQSGGLIRFREGAVTPFSTMEGLSTESPFSVFEDRDGVLWVGTSQGLNRYKDGNVTVFTTKNGLPSDEILSLGQDREGSLWIGSAGGLTRYRDGRFQTYTTQDGMTGNIVFSIFEDNAGLLWTATIGGVSQYSNGKFTTFFRPQERKLCGAMVQSEDGSLWIAVFGGGLKRYRNGTTTDYSTKDGLSSDMVLSLHADRDDLWIGTYERGLNRYRNGTFKQYSTADGLHHDTIYHILEDDSEHLWMSSNNGIFRVSKEQLNDFADGKLKRIESFAYGKADGMRNVECNGGQQPAGWKTRDRQLWFPTANGLVRIDPNHLPVNKTPPPVHLEEVVVDGKPTIPIAQNMSIPPGEGRVEFRYTAISFTAPEKIRFQYKLEGLDKDWVNASDRRVAYFTNLSPKNYTFRVNAANADGIWNQAGAAIPFRLQPHFYQTYWFYSLCAVAVLYGVWQGHRYRLRRMLELERIRMRIATDLHDDIGAGLSQIAILSEVLKRNSGKQEALTQISESSRQLIDSMSDIVWAVNPEKDRMTDLVLRMRKFAHDMLDGKEISFRFHTGLLDEKRELDPDVRRHLYLVYKEGINNLVRHSSCTEAEISLKQSGSELVLTIRDNGKGMSSPESNEERGGHGLRSMKKRAEEIDAKLQIITSPGEGTTLIMHTPL